MHSSMISNPSTLESSRVSTDLSFEMSLSSRTFSSEKMAILIMVGVVLRCLQRNSVEISIEGNIFFVKTAQLVRARSVPIVSGAVDSYFFRTEEERRQFSSIAIDLLVKVSERIENLDSVSVQEFSNELLLAIFDFGFDNKVLIELVGRVWDNVRKEVERGDVEDPQTIGFYDRYEELIVEELGNFLQVASDSVIEILEKTEGYGISDEIINLGETKSRLIRGNREEKDDSIPYVKRLGKRFKVLFDKNVVLERDKIFLAAYDINSVISDSDVKLPSPEEVDLDLLTATFAGEGKKIYDSVINLLGKGAALAGYQGSFAGSIEYKANYLEYLLAMSYGEVLPGSSLGGDFGDFEKIYGEKSRAGEIRGLKFLEPLFTTRSANQSEVSLKPVSSKFLGVGVSDRYELPEDVEASFGSLALEAVYEECLKLGDSVNSVLNYSPKGIGDVIYIFSILQSVFPPSVLFRGREEGLTGAVYRLLQSYKKLYALTLVEPDLGEFFRQIADLSESVQVLSQTIKSAGFRREGGIVASLELKIHTPSKELSAKRLKALGFDPSEVDQIMGSENFSELLERFSPITNSQDVISFFRAFELTKLIYEFGGQEGIDQYVNFLYGIDESKSLLRLLEFLEIGRSTASKVISSKYSKLIGYLITLTYAVNPGELIKLNSILSKNNLNLFESITLLIQQGKSTIVKDKEQIELLSGIAAQMVVSDNSDYVLERDLWNRLIERSAGNAGDLSGLYDNVSGIIPEELNAILNNPSPTSPLGQLMDGVRGGNLTTVLRYCNILGILYSLSGYKNSGQLVNKSAEEFEPILRTVSTMDNLSLRLDLAYNLFRSNSSEARPPSVYSDPLITAQNKSFGALIGVIRGEGVQADFPIVDPPGVGNSRVPNGVRMDNSLSPEEASIIAPLGTSLGVFSRSGQKTTSNGFVRFSIDNLLAAGFSSPVNADQPVITGPEPDQITPEKTISYTVSSSPSSLKIDYGEPFSPNESCRRFGGTECDKDESVICTKGFGKASEPETGYGQSLIPGQENPTVMVDRPLGQSLQSETTNNQIPKSSPSYYFTQYGLNKSSRAGLLKPSEMLCASLDNVFEYSACMSLLKCKKFKPPYLGKYSLPFCPTTLQGGRFNR